MLVDSGLRESNPSHSLGKAGHGRYTKPALAATPASVYSTMFPFAKPFEQRRCARFSMA